MRKILNKSERSTRSQRKLWKKQNPRRSALNAGRILLLFVLFTGGLIALSLTYFSNLESMHASFQAGVWIHDVAITSVTPDTRRVYAGPPVQSYVNITVEAKNNGTLTETFNVTAYYDSTQIGKQTVNNLEPNQTKVLNFIWNTTEMTPCTCYCLSAEADTVHGETHILNNVFVDACVWVTIPGDIDCDGDVDYDDFIVLAGAYGSSSGQPAYRLYADFDCDGDVDYDDFIVLAAYYGKTC